LAAQNVEPSRGQFLDGNDAIIVQLGYVNTPILARFSQGFLAAGRQGLAPTAIGEAVHGALVARRPQVTYTVSPQKFANWTLPRLLPSRVVDRIIGTRLGLVLGGTKGARP